MADAASAPTAAPLASASAGVGAGDTCAVCLQPISVAAFTTSTVDAADGVVVKDGTVRLACAHAFHVACSIKAIFTCKACPVCKRRTIVTGATNDDDDDSDDGYHERIAAVRDAFTQCPEFAQLQAEVHKATDRAQSLYSQWESLYTFQHMQAAKHCFRANKVVVEGLRTTAVTLAGLETRVKERLCAIAAPLGLDAVDLIAANPLPTGSAEALALTVNALRRRVNRDTFQRKCAQLQQSYAAVSGRKAGPVRRKTQAAIARAIKTLEQGYDSDAVAYLELSDDE